VSHLPVVVTRAAGEQAVACSGDVHKHTSRTCTS
jgi:hypothetical protein